MRINKFVALATGVSRRQADELIAREQVTVNSLVAVPGQDIQPIDKVYLSGQLLKAKNYTTIMINKPSGYVCSRDGQGSKTVYDLLPAELANLKPVGRLDKDSSGLLIMTNNGDLANDLTHPSKQKVKVYQVLLGSTLADKDKNQIEQGVSLADGPSALKLNGQGKSWQVTMHEGRNRQIRRTFEALDYKVVGLHRTQIGTYQLGSLQLSKFIVL